MADPSRWNSLWTAGIKFLVCLAAVLLYGYIHDWEDMPFLVLAGLFAFLFPLKNREEDEHSHWTSFWSRRDEDEHFPWSLFRSHRDDDDSFRP